MDRERRQQHCLLARRRHQQVLSWLLGGINTVLSKLVEASRVFWDLLDAIWDFLVGFKDSLLSLFSAWFPWIPAEVTAALSLALLAVVIAGVYKRVRG